MTREAEGQSKKEICQRFEDNILPALKMERKAISQGMQEATPSWKSQRNRFPSRANEGFVVWLIS